VIDADTINVIASTIGVVIPVAIGFLVSHKVVSKRRLTQLYSYAVFAASAAEELYGTETVGGEIKRRYAVDRITKKTGITQEEAELLLHAAVSGLRSAGVKAPKSGNPSAGTVPISMRVVPPAPDAA
jgi:hypothetical protein